MGKRDAPNGILDQGDVVQIIVGTSPIPVRYLFAEFGVAGIDHDAVEPRFETRARGQRVSELPGTEEGLLYGVFGVGSIAEDQVRGSNGTGVAILEPGAEFV